MSAEVEVHDDALDSFEYVDIDMDDFNLNDDGDEDLDTMISTLTTKTSEKQHKEPTVTSNARPAVLVDFFRNFLIRHNLSQTYETFEHEWSLISTISNPARFAESENVNLDLLEPPTDIYIENQQLVARVQSLERQVTEMTNIAETAKSSFEKFKKERDFHKLHHRRVVQEKEKLLTDLKRLKKHYENYPNALSALQEKYQSLMKQKSLLKLENDKLKRKISEFEVPQVPVKKEKSKQSDTITTSIMERTLSVFPTDHPIIPASTTPPLQTFTSMINQIGPEKEGIGHVAAVSSIVVHPTQDDVVLTCSDDCTWRLWDLSSGNFDLVLAATGHTSWIADVDISPAGDYVATACGDGTARLWNLASQTSEVVNNQTTLSTLWGVKFHYTGQFLALCSLDHTAKVFDIGSTVFSNVLTLRGHVDSVNSLAWLPFSNVLATGSADKTVSLWDCRTNQCVQSLFGHTNAVRNVVFTHDTNSIISCDSDGVVYTWDTRNFNNFNVLDAGPYGANSLTVHPSNESFVVCSDDGTLKAYSLNAKGQDHPLFVLTGHEDMVQKCTFIQGGRRMVSVGSDCTIRQWQ
ncbi:hypothetical protein RCL1_002482 [Eukaryota sp. TZLM3-RCL]